MVSPSGEIRIRADLISDETIEVLLHEAEHVHQVRFHGVEKMRNAKDDRYFNTLIEVEVDQFAHRHFGCVHRLVGVRTQD